MSHMLKLNHLVKYYKCLLWCTPEDAAKVGFRDIFIYDFIVALKSKKEDKSLLSLAELNRAECLELFDANSLNQKTVY